MTDIKFRIHKVTSHNPFIVPEGYFDTFAQTMMNKITQSENSAIQHQMSVIRWIPWLGAACVIALFMLFEHLGAHYESTTKDNVGSTMSVVTKNKSNDKDDMYDYIMTSDNKNWAYESDY